MPKPLFKNELIIGPAYAESLCELIGNAENDILILMFDWKWYAQDFSCDVSLINQALIRASRRGVKIRALTNYGEIASKLNSHGILAKVWTGSRLMHAKTIVIDRWVAVLGSHNFTQNAMSLNVEVSIAESDEELCQKLAKYFESLWSL